MFVHLCCNTNLILGAKRAILTPNSNYVVTSLSRLIYFQPARFVLLLIVDYRMIDPPSLPRATILSMLAQNICKLDELQNFTMH